MNLVRVFLFKNSLKSIIVIFTVLQVNACGIIKPFNRHLDTGIKFINLVPNKIDPIMQDSVFENTEFIDAASVKINGILPLVAHSNELFKIFGKPDSIVTPDYDLVSCSFYNEKFTEAYFKESEFEIYGDTAVFRALNLKQQPHNELKAGTITLNSGTTLKDIKKLFPIAYRNRRSINVYEKGEFICVNLAISKQLMDDLWLLFFLKGKLVRIEYYIPD